MLEKLTCLAKQGLSALKTSLSTPVEPKQILLLPQVEVENK